MEKHRKNVGRSPNGMLESTPFAHIFFLHWKPLYPPAIPKQTSKDHRSLEGDAGSIFKKKSNQVRRPRTNCLLGVAVFFLTICLMSSLPKPRFRCKPELLWYCLVDASTACTVPANDVFLRLNKNSCKDFLQNTISS